MKKARLLAEAGLLTLRAVSYGSVGTRSLYVLRSTKTC